MLEQLRREGEGTNRSLGLRLLQLSLPAALPHMHELTVEVDVFPVGRTEIAGADPSFSREPVEGVERLSRRREDLLNLFDAQKEPVRSARLWEHDAVNGIVRHIAPRLCRAPHHADRGLQV